MKLTFKTIVFLLLSNILYGQYKPNYYFGYHIKTVDSAMIARLDYDEVKYIDSLNVKYVRIVDPMPNFQRYSMKETLDWWGDCRAYEYYCLGDIVVNYDSALNEWCYEMIDFKLQYYQWSDNKSKRRVEERIVDRNGKLIRYYDARDLNRIICIGKGCEK